METCKCSDWAFHKARVAWGNGPRVIILLHALSMCSCSMSKRKKVYFHFKGAEVWEVLGAATNTQPPSSTAGSPLSHLQPWGWCSVLQTFSNKQEEKKERGETSVLSQNLP